MNYSKSTQDNVCVIRIEGSLDVWGITDGPAFVEGLQDEAEHVVIDLAQVNRIGSTGIGMLAQSHQVLSRRGLRLMIARPTANIAAVLSACQIEKLIPIRASLDDAIRDCKMERPASATSGAKADTTAPGEKWGGLDGWYRTATSPSDDTPSRPKQI
ncbi:MAG: STAS domain-containing protein [Planctomycetota bacterium]|nr:STAS domain-containing protein [Planctomycetota bacterium]